jgi:hypothetical protein
MTENDCTAVILPNLINDFVNNCVNKSSCSFNALNPAYLNYQRSSNKCQSNYTQIYYQFNCKYTESETNT